MQHVITKHTTTTYYPFKLGALMINEKQSTKSTTLNYFDSRPLFTNWYDKQIQ
jgi:hypothetical protein